MSKNYYSNSMRCVRLAKSKLDNAHQQYTKEVEKAQSLLRRDEITHTVYDRAVTAAQNDFETARKTIFQNAKQELSQHLDSMREIAKQRIVKAPTPETASTLQILATLDRITPTQFALYAEQMADCPIAMQALSQIAAKHEVRIITDEPERRLQLLDVFEDNIANFLQNYTGSADTSSFSIRRLLPYLQAEDKLTKQGGTEKVNRRFWSEFIGDGSSDCYDNENVPAGKPKAQYFFESVDGLMNFIGAEIAGMDSDTAVKRTNEILADCPEKYGAAYRCYKASGEKIDLNE